MPLQFVSITGAAISESQIKAAKAMANQEAARKKKVVELKSFHKGWKVTGIPPGALEQARAEALRLGRIEERNGRAAKEFNEAHWLANHKGKAVRAKPYEIESSASECAELATKAGWLRVQIEEVKRVVEKTPSLSPL